MLAGVMEKFIYLKVGLSFVLCFVGVKMLIVDVYKIPIGLSLSAIGAILLSSIFASWWFARTRSVQGPRRDHAPSPWARRVPARPGAYAPSLATSVTLAIVLVATLILVKWNAIVSGPTADEAIVVLRMVERDFAAAKSERFSDPSAMSQVGVFLDEAWSKLEEKRYEEAIKTGQAADRVLARSSRMRTNW
jgi:hypothetical protein